MLRFALILNVIFSCVSAGCAIFFKEWLSLHIPLPQVLFLLLGGGLLSFAAVILWIQSALERRLLWGGYIVWADIGWVVSTFTLAAFFSSYLSNIGWSIVFFINASVATLALLQWIGWRKLREESQ